MTPSDNYPTLVQLASENRLRLKDGNRTAFGAQIYAIDGFVCDEVAKWQSGKVKNGLGFSLSPPRRVTPSPRRSEGA